MVLKHIPSAFFTKLCMMLDIVTWLKQAKISANFKVLSNIAICLA